MPYKAKILPYKCLIDCLIKIPMTTMTININAIAKTKATTKQVTFLRQLGHTGDADTLTTHQASELIEQLKIALDEAKARILASGLSVRDMADQVTTLHRATPQESAGPCPKCGGTDRFHVQADWFFCRHCHEKRGDVIEFVQWKNNITFVEAIQMLDGNSIGSLPATKRAPAIKPQFERPPDWQKDANNLAERAHWRLMDDDDSAAIAARDYLDSRGIETHTWQAFKLGYAPSVAIPGTQGKERAPAIVMPWYKGGKVCGVRYRFLEKQGDCKQTALAGSIFGGVLYGGQALETGTHELSTLLICEGELNACSIWQCSRYTSLNVLSLGSESAAVAPAMVEYASRYATVMVWLDKEERAQSAMAALPGAYAIKSVEGQDANDSLRSGELGALLAVHRYQATKNQYEQKRLYSDLQATTKLPGGVDEATAQVIAHIGKTLK